MIINCGKNELSRITGKQTGIIMTEKKQGERNDQTRKHIEAVDIPQNKSLHVATRSNDSGMVSILREINLK